jgi:hypothetical protein
VKTRVLALTHAILLLAATAAAQPAPEPLFFELSLGATASTARDVRQTARREVIARRLVGVHLDRLFAGAARGQRLALRLDDDRSVVAVYERLDIDRAVRSWVGTLEGVAYSHVVISERDGVLSGLVDAVSDVYQLVTTAPGVHALERIDRRLLRGERDPLTASVAAARVAPLLSDAAADTAAPIDVLVLYTPSARDARGGATAIELAGVQAISDANTAFLRSGIATRQRFVGAVEVPYTESATMERDLLVLTDLPVVRELRDVYGADLVHVFLNSPDLAACGVAWLLRDLNSASFTAYSVSDVSCIPKYTPAHEMGHNMGAHHAPEDGAFDPIFPFAYGFKDPARAFRTVMAYACSGEVDCPRILNFSNPEIPYNGTPSGTAAQNNALAINLTATVVASWRQEAAATLTPPGQPTELRSRVDGNAVTLSWNRSSALWANYTLLVGTMAGVPDLFKAALGNASTISGIVGPGLYYWWVVPDNVAGTGPASAVGQFTVGPTCIAPAAPQNFEVAVNGRVVTLSWTPSSPGPVEHYIVDAGSAPGLTDLVSASTGSAAAMAVTPAPPGTYYVRVRAQNACGVSGPSNEQRVVVF